MPVGISFENSALKNSFSLSSFPPASDTTPDNSVKKRQFNSLTKNRVKATAVRRSWGSTASDHREEFWSVLQANYNYIMDNQLIDKCQEVDNDLNSINTGTWSLNEFYSRFSELYSMLDSVQETIYGKEENITDKALRANCVNKVLEKSSSLKIFNDQASQLVQLYPEEQEEVGWKTTHLNSKWDSILSILEPSDCDHCKQDTCLDIDHELKCLRKWFKIMETRLQPLDFRAKYTKTEIEKKALELKVLHSDIENHRKIVGSVVKLCKKSDANKCNTVNTRRNANGLERRWHLLFLRSLEWQCYLESLSKRQNFKNSTSSSSEESDSDCCREPANKYPRLSSGRNSARFDYSSSEDDSASASAIINEDGMTENGANKDTERNNGNDIVDGNFKAQIEDTSQFNKPNKTPNCATYYFKHEDTEESDMEKLDKIDGQSTLEETSEDDEWTYTRKPSVINYETVAQLNDNEPATPSNETCDNKIQMNGNLQADIEADNCTTSKPKAIPEDTIRKLVLKAEELVSPEKCRKNLNKMSRINKWLSMDNKPDDSCDASGEDDERESIASEDFNASTMTLREGNQSRNVSFTELNGQGKALWCGSCSSELNQVVPSTTMQYSISESALNRIALSSANLDYAVGVNGNNSTSSTVEEISPVLAEKTSPVRKKKMKLRKKSLFGKCDQMHHSQKHRNLLIKSGSFSGYSAKLINNERNISSDPSAGYLCTHGCVYETSTTSGADSDEDACRRMILKRFLTSSEIRDNSPGKSSLNTAEEQSSSFSEAWDNYQENYLSEAYSESHDSDAARKLLNFGEDYRNFIDSQSDWSALSDMSPKFKRKNCSLATNAEQDDDSDSDEESLKQLINESKTQLDYAEDIYSKIKDGINNGMVANNEMDNLMTTCDKHIALLNYITDSCDDYKMTNADKVVTTGLFSQWRSLRNSAKMEEYKKLQKQIDELKFFINSVYIPERGKVLLQSMPMEDIQHEIEACNKLLDSIKSQSSKLSSLNAVVHRFSLENKEDNSLKSDISELYELFDLARTYVTEKLGHIESLLPVWKTLESRLDQLQKDLNEDKKRIHQLDAALTNGTFTDQNAECVRDVAKVLSESTSHKGYSEFFTEGSFSDSGISDEGSEHEIGERQGRLAAIRRLVRQLEVRLSPDSKARLLMREKLDAAEEELKALQQRCRSLISRTAACSIPTPDLRLSSGSVKTSAKPEDGDGDPDSDPQGPSWFKRAFKASLAFQLVILTFVCLSCFFEPQCCDYMNNYSWTLSPKLHYEGRPPI